LKYTAETQKAKDDQRKRTLADFERPAEEAGRTLRIYGPVRDEADKRKLDERLIHIAEFQRRWLCRKAKDLELYKERIQEVERQQPPETSPVSMEHNPARFLPCRRRSDGRSVGEGVHCGMHRLHNLTNPMVEKSLNKGILKECVSSTTHLSSEYHWADLRSAMNFFMVPSLHEDIKHKTSFYSEVMKLVLEVMELETLIEQCEFDVKKGVTPPKTAGIARWGTALEAAQYLFRNHPLIGFAIVKRFAKGREETKIQAAADTLKPCGFDTSKYQNLQIEYHAEKSFAMVTNTSDLVQLAILSLVNAVVERFLLKAISSDHECGLEAKGLKSVLRCVLMVLERDMWVLFTPHRGWGRGWNRWTPLAFRTHGAEFSPETGMRLLNPQCGDKLKKRYHAFPEYSELVVEAVAAINAFGRAVNTLARRPGPMLPEDSLALWREAHPDLARLSAEAPAAGADSKHTEEERVPTEEERRLAQKLAIAQRKHTQIFEGRESYAARVSQAYWLLRRVARDCVDGIVREHGGMHRELFGLSGWIADMSHSELSPELRIQMPDKTVELSAVVVSQEIARASAANLYVLARDLLAHYQQRGVGSELLKS
jgi:hypothetical protein